MGDTAGEVGFETAPVVPHADRAGGHVDADAGQHQLRLAGCGVVLGEPLTHPLLAFGGAVGGAAGVAVGEGPAGPRLELPAARRVARAGVDTLRRVVDDRPRAADGGGDLTVDVGGGLVAADVGHVVEEVAGHRRERVSGEVWAHAAPIGRTA